MLLPGRWTGYSTSRFSPLQYLPTGGAAKYDTYRIEPGVPGCQNEYADRSRRRVTRSLRVSGFYVTYASFEFIQASVAKVLNAVQQPLHNPKPDVATTVFLVEDHKMVRDGLIALISLEPAFKVIGEASNGADALLLIEEWPPDVALIDLVMPKIDGIELTRRLKAQWPKMAVIMLTASTDTAVIRSAVAAGVDCFLRKHDDSQELLDALYRAREGNVVLSEEIQQLIRMADADERIELTPRERQIVTLISRGMTNEEIGAMLHISLGTARKHRENLMKKLGVHNVAELTTYALQAGLFAAVIKN